MNSSDLHIGPVTRGLVTVQASISVIAATLFLVSQSTSDAMSSLYGGLVALLSTLLLSRDVRRAERVAIQNSVKSMRILYMGAAQRFLFVVVALAFGLTQLNCEPIAMVTTFAMVQISYLIGTRRLGNNKTNFKPAFKKRRVKT